MENGGKSESCFVYVWWLYFILTAPKTNGLWEQNSNKVESPPHRKNDHLEMHFDWPLTPFYLQAKWGLIHPGEGLTDYMCGAFVITMASYLHSIPQGEMITDGQKSNRYGWPEPPLRECDAAGNYMLLFLKWWGQIKSFEVPHPDSGFRAALQNNVGNCGH